MKGRFLVQVRAEVFDPSGARKEEECGREERGKEEEAIDRLDKHNAK